MKLLFFLRLQIITKGMFIHHYDFQEKVCIWSITSLGFSLREKEKCRLVTVSIREKNTRW